MKLLEREAHLDAVGEECHYGKGVRPTAVATATDEPRTIRSGRDRGQYQTTTERG
jgi:hypothetical protein